MVTIVRLPELWVFNCFKVLTHLSWLILIICPCGKPVNPGLGGFMQSGQG